MSLPLPTLVLSGFMATGKSTVGRLVALGAGVPFVDLDAQIAQRSGLPVDALFAERGEAHFRALEAEALREALAGASPCVIAVGGGALVNDASRAGALSRARVVTLVARPQTLARRLEREGPPRPLLEGAADLSARLRDLLAERADAYAASHARVPTDGLTPTQVADAVRRAWHDPSIVVPLGPRTYAVRIASDPAVAVAELVAVLDPSKVFLVTDHNVEKAVNRDIEHALGARGMRLSGTVALPPGEEHKHLGAVEHVLSTLVTLGADRDALVVAQGGGVVSDIAGFAAATLLRGVRWVAVPTTLLAMVDASVGGKTGVDLGPSKNAVGAFHQPAGVVIGPDYVATETRRGYVGGLAEVVKTGAVGDAALIELLEREADRILARDPSVVREVVARAVSVKAGIVARDERESGERAHLNFGHTVGHAIEAEGGYARRTHGEAVALGMIAALRAGERLGVTPADVARRVERLLRRLELPTDLDAEPLASALPLVAFDKKRRGAGVRLVLLTSLAAPTTRTVTPTELADLLRP